MAEERVVAQLSPYPIEVEAGKRYLWCRCGRSQKQPFCDGAHKDTGIEPMVYVAETTGVVNFCGCKETDDEPICDGAHNML